MLALDICYTIGYTGYIEGIREETNMNAVIDSKNQNTINSFQTAANELLDAKQYEYPNYDGSSARATMRLAYWNMSIEAQGIAYNWYITNINPVWMEV